MNIGALWLEQRITLLLVNPDFTALLCLLVGGSACLEENAARAVVGSWLSEVAKINPGATEDRLHVIGALTLLGRWRLLATFVLSGSLRRGQLHESEPAAAIIFDSFFKLNQFETLLFTQGLAN